MNKTQEKKTCIKQFIENTVFFLFSSETALQLFMVQFLIHLLKIRMPRVKDDI